jgi:hypothetical protein
MLPEGTVRHLRTADSIANVVSLLAGDAYERPVDEALMPHVGSGTRSTRTKPPGAGAQVLEGGRLQDAIALASEAADDLVRTSRFRAPVRALAPVDRSARFFAPQIWEVLDAADPGASQREGSVRTVVARLARQPGAVRRT